MHLYIYIYIYIIFLSKHLIRKNSSLSCNENILSMLLKFYMLDPLIYTRGSGLK